jgi:uncharacterized damage-inducible protein DinB
MSGGRVRTAPTAQRVDFLEALEAHRSFLRQTVRGLTDDQARQRTTVSELCLAGIVKHVAAVEDRWARFIVEGPDAIGSADKAAMEEHAAGFVMLKDETLASVLERYEDVAHRTDDLVASIPSLDDAHPLPDAPWFPPGTAWSARRVLIHIIAETAQHAGHADIIRESLDGQKTMG